MTEEIQLTIDGVAVRVEHGATILEAAKKANIEIPVICYSAHTTANGLCRLCVVEIEGVRGLQAACVTQAQDGTSVSTRSETIDRVRRTILEMLATSADLSDGPEIMALMDTYQVDLDRFSNGETRHRPVIDDNPMYVRDYAKCVMCWRCVQVCADDAQYTYAINFAGRGFHTEISTFFQKPMTQTTCVFCGQCVGACPTGALKGKREFLLEQGVPPDEIFAVTRKSGVNQRSRLGPHLQQGG